MKAEKIELGQFYRYSGDDECFTIFVFCLEYHSFVLNNTPTECEKWIYWNVGKKIIGHFTYLDKKFIACISLLEAPIPQRNMKNIMLDNAEEDNENIRSWLELKDQMLNEFIRNTVLPEVLITVGDDK